MTDPSRMTILFDNYPGVPGLTSLWGFAALIRVADRTILFDTGSNGRVLLKNMVALDSDPPEHAMVIETDGVAAVISGCAHPGMERIVEHASRLLGKKIDWAIGGFHLMYSDSAGIDRAIRALQDLEVAYVVPTHCTGNAARDAFR